MSTQTFGRKQMQAQVPVPDVEHERTVGVLFAIGIFFLPYIFAWPLLRQGHSSTSRTLGFGWLAAVIVSAYTLPFNANTTGIGEGPATLTQEPAPAWQYSTSEDAMRGTTTHFAVATASNILHFDFPYAGGSTAQFGVVRSGDELRAGLTISKGQFTCFGGMNGDVVSMKFDSGSVLNFPCFRSADGNSQVIGIGDADELFRRLRKAKKLVVEAQFFQAGNQQMTFNVEGFKW